MEDPNEAFAKDCGGHWENGVGWVGCGVCERCRAVEDDLLEKDRARVGRRDVGCYDSDPEDDRPDGPMESAPDLLHRLL